jgi:hypothetical protein
MPQIDFMKETTDTIQSILSFEDYGCFRNFDISVDLDRSDAEEEYFEYKVTFEYETYRFVEPTQIEFWVRVPEDDEDSRFKDDFEMNTYEDNWHGVSYLSGGEVLWMTVLQEVERHYANYLDKK